MRELKSIKARNQSSDQDRRDTAAMEKELAQLQARSDELLKNAMLERLEKDQEIINLETQNETLRSQLVQLKGQFFGFFFFFLLS